MSKKQPRYFLSPLDLTPATPPHIALEVLVRKTGDTYGLVRIHQKGDLELWRNGRKVGNYGSFNAVYSALDRLS